MAQEKIAAAAAATESPSSPAPSSKKTETSGKKLDKTQKKKKNKKETVTTSSKKVESEKPKDILPVAATPEKPVQQEEILFQAIGTLSTSPYIKDDELKVKIDELEYDLVHVPGIMKKIYKALKKELSENGSNKMLLKVYPNPGLSSSNNQPRLSLSLSRFKLNNFDDNKNSNFIIKGIWPGGVTTPLY